MRAARMQRVRQVTASVAASWQVVEILRADGEIYRDIRPLVRVNVAVVAGEGDRQETGSYGFGGREGFQRFITPDAWQGAVDEAITAGAGEISMPRPRPAGRDGRRARLRAGRASCCTKPSATASRATSIARRLLHSPAYGQTGCREGRHRRRRRHHASHGAAHCRSTMKARPRNRTRPDRGWHARRLHAGPLRTRGS